MNIHANVIIASIVAQIKNAKIAIGFVIEVAPILFMIIDFLNSKIIIPNDISPVVIIVIVITLATTTVISFIIVPKISSNTVEIRIPNIDAGFLKNALACSFIIAFII